MLVSRFKQFDFFFHAAVRLVELFQLLFNHLIDIAANGFLNFQDVRAVDSSNFGFKIRYFFSKCGFSGQDTSSGFRFDYFNFGCLRLFNGVQFCEDSFGSHVRIP